MIGYIRNTFLYFFHIVRYLQLLSFTDCPSSSPAKHELTLLTSSLLFSISTARVINVISIDYLSSAQKDHCHNLPVIKHGLLGPRLGQGPGQVSPFFGTKKGHKISFLQRVESESQVHIPHGLDHLSSSGFEKRLKPWTRGETLTSYNIVRRSRRGGGRRRGGRERGGSGGGTLERGEEEGDERM